jgi:hypothetical protein
MNDKDKLKAIEKVQTLLIHLGALEELTKQCREEIVEYAKKYKLSIDFENHQVTDWGDLKGE